MARSSKLITASVALVACIALHSLAFLSGPAPATQLRGSTPLEVAAGAAVPAVMMTPTAAMAADGEGMPSVVLGVGILCMLAAFSAVSSVISATEENHARADEWKVLVAELADLRASRAAMESKCDGLTTEVKKLKEEAAKQRRLADTFRQESEMLKGDVQKLQKTVLDAAAEQQGAAEQAERMRTETADLEAARRAAQRELAELRRQAERWAAERGELEADSARLQAAKEALEDDNRTLMQRIEAMAPKPESEEAYQAAMHEAEQWVLYHAGMPLEGSSLPYLKGVIISFPEFFSHMIPIALASPPKQLRSAAGAVESGELARASLQSFRLCDAHRHGILGWEDEEVSDLIEAVFQRKGLQAPPQDAQRRMFAKFDEDDDAFSRPMLDSYTT
ncbi:unnamed protein product [Symbiodinium microadriaticum]|nr:unnamed protein product [Symbiodinium microadriaticum]